MQLAEVVGTVVATVKDEGLHGQKLLVVQPISASGAAAGGFLVALDSVGVGTGERVFYVKGKEASFVFLPGHVPADCTIVGKVDGVASDEQPPPKPKKSGKR
jgi:microcompartment protein CcmK/EutM